MSGQDYGVFIWSSYGATAAIVLGLIVRAVLQHRAQSRALARLEAGSGGLSGAGEQGVVR